MYYVYKTDDLYKWLHYNYLMASYYSLCHVTCTYNLKLDEVKVTEEHALFCLLNII